MDNWNNNIMYQHTVPPSFATWLSSQPFNVQHHCKKSKTTQQLLYHYLILFCFILPRTPSNFATLFPIHLLFSFPSVCFFLIDQRGGIESKCFGVVQYIIKSSVSITSVNTDRLWDRSIDRRQLPWMAHDSETWCDC